MLAVKVFIIYARAGREAASPSAASAVATMWRTSRPASSYWRAGVSCSTKRSGNTIGRIFKPVSSAPWARQVTVATVFFGGGTPSLLDVGEMAGVLAALRRAFVVDADAEVTVECNPESVTLEKLAETQWFASWDPELDTTRQARELVSRLVEELRNVPKRTKALVSKPVRAAIKDLNKLDKKQQFIDTIEREEICEAFEQIVCAAGQPSLVHEIDNWRDW